MTLEEAKVWISKQTWVIAKSYSQTFPHVYTTRDRSKDEFEFEEFIGLIRDHGIVKTFFSKQYVYLEIDGEEFWEMGRPIKAVQVLNRAKINDCALYRLPKPSDFDSMQLKSKLNKRECVINTILNKQELNTEESRILKFLMNSERRIHGGGKNIIDHSKIELRYE
jgi:hypothetical protein